MKNKFKISFLISVVTLIFFASLFCISDVLAVENDEGVTDGSHAYQVRLFFFGTSTCPHCKEEKKFLPKLEEKYSNLEVYYFDVNSFEGADLFMKVVDEYGLTGGVPVSIIGENAVVGFNNEENIGKNIENLVKKCSLSTCDSKVNYMLDLPPVSQVSINSDLNDELRNKKNEGEQKHKHSDEEVIVTVFGREICTDDLSSPCILGVILGLADGINPCMFSVLFFVLSYLLVIGSRKRALRAGIAFVVTTFLVYFLFMYGIIQVVDFLGIASLARVVISIIALIIGVIMIKDFFFYGKFVSLEIPKAVKPTLEKLVRKGTVPSAVLLAILASIVELPCTSGLPLAYISVLSAGDISYFWHIALYNLFFILPLVIIVILVVFFEKKTEDLENWRKSSRKYMRLTAGALLILLSLALWQNWL